MYRKSSMGQKVLPILSDLSGGPLQRHKLFFFHAEELLTILML